MQSMNNGGGGSHAGGGSIVPMQVGAVESVVKQVTRSLPSDRGPGWQESWDGSTGNVMRQFSPPQTDPLAPWPIFTYNRLNSTGPGEFGINWNMNYQQRVIGVNSTTAVVHRGNGLSLTYTNKDADGVYTAPAGAENKLVQNGDSTWSQTNLDGGELSFDTSGKLVKVIEGDRIWTISHDGGGRVSQITDPAGRNSDFVYGAVMGVTRLKRFVDVVGRITSFLFDMSGNARVFIDALGGRYTFGAGISPGMLTSWKEPDGATTQYSFLASDSYKLWKVTTPGGQVSEIGYGASYNNFANPLGARTTTGFTAGGDPRYVLNPLGQRTTMTVSGGRVTSVQNPKAEQVELSYATGSGGIKQLRSVALPGSARYTYLFDSNDRVRASISPMGFRESFLWDDSGNQRARIDCHGHRTTFLYTSANVVRAVIDAMGNRTTTLYDSSGRVRATLLPTGARTTYGYNSLSQLATVKNPLGCVTTTLWDSLNRLRVVIDQSGARTTFTLDSAGRVKAVKNPLGHVSTTLYDANGRERARIDALGNRTTLGYDAAGNRVTVKNPLGHVVTSVFDKTNRQVAAVDPLGNRTTFGFDSAGRQVTFKNPLAKVWTNVWNSDGHQVASVDPLGNRTSFTSISTGGRSRSKTHWGTSGRRSTTARRQCAPQSIRWAIEPRSLRTRCTAGWRRRTRWDS